MDTKYHKIQSLYLRDPATKHKTFLPKFAREEFGVLYSIPWEAEEKVDGTNIRVSWTQSAERPVFGGRTDRASIPAPLVAYLQETFTPEKMRREFNVTEQDDGTVITLYGEGYGARIQKGGGNYIPDGVAFCLFDIRVGRWWLARDAVRATAEQLGVPFAPSFGRLHLSVAEEMVKAGFNSALAQVPNTLAEGLILRPAVELFDRAGRRIITKLKTRDYAHRTHPARDSDDGDDS